MFHVNCKWCVKMISYNLMLVIAIGIVSCVPAKNAGSDHANKSEPLLWVTPELTVLQVGESGNISCRWATHPGSKIAYVFWSWGNDVKNGTIFSIISRHGEQILAFSPVKKEHEGHYHCIGSDAEHHDVGNVTAELRVNSPRISTAPKVFVDPARQDVEDSN